jgi:hypothetical protein
LEPGSLFATFKRLAAAAGALLGRASPHPPKVAEPTGTAALAAVAARHGLQTDGDGGFAEGSVDDRAVVLQLVRAEQGQTHTRVHTPLELPPGFAVLPWKALPDDAAVRPLGDPAFDRLFQVQGDLAEHLARHNCVARQAWIAAADGQCASVADGVLAIEAPRRLGRGTLQRMLDNLLLLASGLELTSPVLKALAERVRDEREPYRLRCAALDALAERAPAQAAGLAADRRVSLALRLRAAGLVAPDGGCAQVELEGRTVVMERPSQQGFRCTRVRCTVDLPTDLSVVAAAEGCGDTTDATLGDPAFDVFFEVRGKPADTLAILSREARALWLDAARKHQICLQGAELSVEVPRPADHADLGGLVETLFLLADRLEQHPSVEQGLGARVRDRREPIGLRRAALDALSQTAPARVRELAADGELPAELVVRAHLQLGGDDALLPLSADPTATGPVRLLALELAHQRTPVEPGTQEELLIDQLQTMEWDRAAVLLRHLGTVAAVGPLTRAAAGEGIKGPRADLPRQAIQAIQERVGVHAAGAISFADDSGGGLALASQPDEPDG